MPFFLLFDCKHCETNSSEILRLNSLTSDAFSGSITLSNANPFWIDASSKNVNMDIGTFFSQRAVVFVDCI